MSQQPHKLSPSEFLAQLKQANAQAAPVAVADDSLDDFDFNGLGGEQSATAPEAPASNTPNVAGDDVPTKLPPNQDVAASPVGTNGATPGYLSGNSHLAELFDRVNSLLGASKAEDGVFRPKAPESLQETGLTFEEVERLILKYLLAKGSSTGRGICAQIRLSFQIVDPILKQLKQDQLVAFRGAAQMGDYEFAITEMGRDRARRYSEECTYFGSAPVALPDYLEAMAAQSIAKQEATEDDLRAAFADLIVSQKMLERLGPAINSGRGMFLYGAPGNGKTSIAERITRCFGSTIWIPRTLGIAGDIMRVFDPGVHEVIEENTTSGGIFDLSGVDQRWVQIVRPTVVAGGELQMDELEVVQNPQTKICEAPLQLKSNCGTLVIDDFGRQTMPVDVLLNRWIVPLEKRYDFLNMPSGKKVQVPFDQLIIFSTNLEPKDLVDGAFLRRIPYKIEVPDPSEDEFHALCELMCPLMGFEYNRDVITYLIEKHYKTAGRPFRACQPRDLLQQVRNYCTFKKIPRKITRDGFDFAVENYFSVM